MVTIINITQDDINNGIRTSACYCPIALAIRRECKNENLVIVVGGRSIRFRLPLNTSAIVYLPFEAIEFIKKFDNNLFVNPFSFQVSIPDSLMKEISHEN